MVTHIFLQTVVGQGKANPIVFMEAWYSSVGANELLHQLVHQLVEPSVQLPRR